MAIDLINGRTPEEIKRRLRCASFECDDINCESVRKKSVAQEALAYIERLEAAKPRWISVKERLPEKLNENNQVYLSEEVIGFDGECAYIGQFKVYKYDGHKTFFDGNCFREDVTHWMPLPEPPEDEE